MKLPLTTLEDVARQAGVSQQTVSRVLNHPAMVSLRTQQKVMDAMQALNYVPNRSAQLLAGKTLPTMGLVTTSLMLHAPSQIASAIKSYADLENYQVTIAMVKTVSLSTMQGILNEFRAQNINGVIISVPMCKDDAEHLASRNHDMQCLFLDVPTNCQVCHLGFDHRDGTRASVEYLYQSGHRRFALLAGPQDAISSQLRLASWQQALKDIGINDIIIEYGDWSAASGREKTFVLMGRDPEVTAILVANDQMSLGVLSALHQLKKSVPEDISVIGYDDTPESQYYLPPLTTVMQDFDLLGKRAISHLIAMLKNPHERVMELIPTHLVRRQSTNSVNPSRDQRELLIDQLKILINRL